jgi:mannosyltransferase OCH1-like enzyme
MIPRVLHQVWVGPRMPDHLRAYGDRWRELHPGWDFRLWGDDDLGWLEHRDLWDRGLELAPRNLGQFRSNIARIEILWREGGVYSDCDMEPRKPLDPIIDVSAFAMWHNPPQVHDRPIIGNALVGSEAGHPALRAFLDGLRDNVRAKAGMRSTYTTGVRYFSRVMAGRDDVTLYPFGWAYPYTLRELKRAGELFPDAYAVHHWNNVRSGGHTGRRA